MADLTEVTVPELPECDIHKQYVAGVPALYDGKTVHGPWAYMCQPCFDALGVGLGLGKGQRLIVQDRAL